MALNRSKAPHPRRTREHVIASQSSNYIEKFFIDRGHTAERYVADYGYDLLINTFDEEGYLEDGEIRVQLKASDHLNDSRRREFISFKISMKHYKLWTEALMPVFLVVYDAQNRVAYWLEVQEYFRSEPRRTPAPGVKSITLRIPLANTFNEATVDHARERKAALLAEVKRRLPRHED